jgi:ATPase family associated with various cellular activities (AAA)
MARADLLVSLIRAAASGDRETMRSTAEALAADERAKKHHILADRLQRALAAVPITPPPFTTSAVVGVGSGREAIIEIEPRTRLDDLLLPLPVRENGRQLVEEHMRADVLRAHGYEPRHRVLLSGPPGNGKTSYAEGIAEALALPLFVVRYDALIGSYLGETNARLRKLFDYIRTRPCVLFFDEFDAIGKERGDTHETGEIKRVVSLSPYAARPTAQLCHRYRGHQPCRAVGSRRLAPISVSARLSGTGPRTCRGFPRPNRIKLARPARTFGPENRRQTRARQLRRSARFLPKREATKHFGLGGREHR